jgi:hypothetical protein
MFSSDRGSRQRGAHQRTRIDRVEPETLNKLPDASFRGHFVAREENRDGMTVNSCAPRLVHFRECRVERFHDPGRRELPRDFFGA